MAASAGKKSTPPVRPLVPPRGVVDPEAARVLREHHDRLTTLMGLPAVSTRIIADQQLEDGVETPIIHGLGRRPVFVRDSCVRGAVTTGRVEEVRSTKHSRDTHVVLKASGWGATITVDVEVK